MVASQGGEAGMLSATHFLRASRACLCIEQLHVTSHPARGLTSITSTWQKVRVHILQCILPCRSAVSAAAMSVTLSSPPPLSQGAYSMVPPQLFAQQLNCVSTTEQCCSIIQVLGKTKLPGGRGEAQGAMPQGIHFMIFMAILLVD